MISLSFTIEGVHATSLEARASQTTAQLFFIIFSSKQVSAVYSTNISRSVLIKTSYEYTCTVKKWGCYVEIFATFWLQLITF